MSVFRHFVSAGFLHRIKSISFSRDGRLHFVASVDGDASRDVIFSVDDDGGVDVVAARDDVKWIGDIDVLNNGVVLMR